jgi:GDP-mannose 6-dehydrogenase
MYITVFGLGRAGAVTAALLAHLGHNVYGVDTDLDKLALLRLGRIPFYEPDLSQYVYEGLDTGRLSITTDGEDAVRHSEFSLICVGTPNCDGGVELSAVYNVLETIGKALREHTTYHVVVLRSTVPIPELDKLLLHLEIKSRLEVGQDFGFCVNPEFLREGSAIKDFLNPPFVLIGQENKRAGKRLRELYNVIMAPQIMTDYRTAMLVKYVSNAWHALKIVFANEIGGIANALHIAPQEVMGVVTQDTMLNVSPAYMRPGGPYGGSCLPKDLTALLRMTMVQSPVLAAIPQSNALHILDIIERILASGRQRIGVVGLSFKPDTDDLRGSPWAAVVDALLKAGRDVKIYDPDVSHVMAGRYRDMMVEEFDDLEAWAEQLFYAKPELVPNSTQEEVGD